MYLTYIESIQHRHINVGSRDLLQGREKEWVIHTLQNLELLEDFQQSIFKGKVRERVWLVVADLLILESFTVQLSMGAMSWFYSKPPTGQVLFSVLQLFIFIGREKCYTFKGQSLENGLSCPFEVIGNSNRIRQ